ncbi:hypothetical protein N0V94_007468 [Neodidymelliopsis sp. IMI 364377]|nr:hypothetical protein N0V94_007468 [Neodidymelliopsis sp. IMI 364377]
MRSSTVVALFAGSAAAQSTAVVFNLLSPVSTLTVLGTNSGTTTYVNSCPATNVGIPSATASGASSASSTGSASVTSIARTGTATPSATAPARLRRQNGLFPGCEPFTLLQGTDSLVYHMTDPTPGMWTIDMNCNWKGEMKTADFTCTATQSGSFAKTLEVEGSSSSVLKSSELTDSIQTATIVQPASNSASATASGSQSGSQSGSAGATSSGSGATAQATGAAAGAPLPKGAMALVGGAAGVFAAALAL